MSLKEQFIALFAFTRAERKGILVLTTLILLLIVYTFLAPRFFPPELTDTGASRDEINAWFALQELDSAQRISNPAGADSYRVNQDSDPLFEFDPNTIRDEEWKKLGLRDGQIKSIRNYLTRGGHFHVRSDLSKMYAISPEQYESLYPFILLPDHSAPSGHGYPEAGKESTRYPATHTYADLKIELNSADTTELKKLRGIGSFLARKIVEYREKLGGFCSIAQLTEVYRMTPGKVDTLSSNLVVDPGLVRGIAINQVTVIDLSKHPYLNAAQAKSIIAYREMHGPFNRVEDIRKSVLIDENTYQKISPYLRIE